MPVSPEFRLLYRVEALGLDQLDGLSKKFAQIDIETKHSAAAVQDFESKLRILQGTGTSYRNAIEAMSRSSAQYGSTVSQVAKDVLKNDAAMRASAQESAREAQRLAAEEQRAADQRARAANMVAREVEAAVERQRRALLRLQEQQERQAVAGLRGAGGLLGAGGRGASGIGMMFGGGLGGMAAGMGIALAVEQMGSLVTKTTESARTLQNFADELDISAAKAFKFQAAARLAGVEIGTFGMGIRRLALAQEDPGGAGKPILKALGTLNVSTALPLGDQLLAALHGLNNIKDSVDGVTAAAQRAALAAALFSSRSWVGMDRAATQIDNVKQKLDEGVQRKLLDAQATLADFGNTWTIWEGKGVAALTSIAGALRTVQQLVTHSTALVPVPHPQFIATVGPFPNAPNYADVRRAIGSDSSKLSLDERAEAAKKAYDTATAVAGQHADLAANNNPAITRTVHDKDLADVARTRAEYERLEALRKNFGKPDEFRIHMNELNERAAVSDEANPLAAIDRQRFAFEQNPLNAAKLRGGLGNRDRMDELADFAVLRNRAQVGIQGRLDTERTSIDDQVAQHVFDYSKKFSGIKPAFDTGLPNPADIKEANKLSNEDYEALRKSQTGFTARQAGLQQSLRRASGTDTPGTDYSASLAAANQELALKLDLIARERGSDHDHADAIHAIYDYMASEDEARIKREEAIAAVGKQQREESGKFFSGLVDASLSGRPSATTNYLDTFGKNIFSHIVSNAAESTIGGMNQWTGLGKTGVLGSPDQRSMIGKIVKGTPLDFSAKEMGDWSKQHPTVTPLEDATKKNTDATAANTSAILGFLKASGVDTSGMTGSGISGASGGGGGGSSIPGTLTSLGGSAASVTRAIQSGNPAAVMQALSSASGIGRVRGGDGAAAMPSIAGIFGRPSGGGNSVAFSAPGSATGADGLPLPSLSGSSLTTLAPNLGFGAATDRTGDVAAGTGAASRFSSLLGGAKYGVGGYGADAVFNGIGVNSDGSAESLSSSQRLGAGLAMAGQVAGGVMTALKGFSKGGARGELQGIAGSAMAIAPFTGPAAPFIEAGASIAELVSALLPDPRQQRIKQEQLTLLNNAYIRPSSHDYSFSATGNGGVGWNEGGGMQTGAPTANHTYNINAMDAQSFYQMVKSDPAALADAILTGIQSGGSTALNNEISWHAVNG